MNIINDLIKAIKEILAEDIEIFEYNKQLVNGGIERKLTIKQENSKIAPQITVDVFLDKIEAGMPIEEAAHMIVNIYNNSLKSIPEFDEDMFNDKALWINKVYGQLINTARNKDMLKKVLHKDFLDMSVIYRIKLQEGATVTVTNELARISEATLDEVNEAAMKNIKDDAIAITMYEAVSSEINLEELVNELDPEGATSELYVLSNTGRVYGAVSLLCTDKLQELAEQLEDDLVILPSSIHEVLVASRSSFMNISEARQMVMEVNDNEVEPNEILSYEVYSYNRAEGKISIA